MVSLPRQERLMPLPDGLLFLWCREKYKKVNMPVACLRGLAFHPEIQRPRERPSMGAGVRGVGSSVIMEGWQDSADGNCSDR